MKSSWISSNADLRRALLTGGLALALALALSPAASAKKRAKRDLAELTNVFLGPSYSQWLVGPIYRMASEEEIVGYLALEDDSAADRFIDAFWERRKPSPDDFLNEARDLYDARVREADRLYREAGQPGRRTDRGAIYVLFGAPEETVFEDPPRRGWGTIEVWKYPKDAPPGLGGDRPKTRYSFAKRGDLTVEYTLPVDRRVRDRNRPGGR